MKKNGQLGEKETEKLLMKLQESVLSDTQKKKEPAPDRDELDFQNKIAAMLAKFTGSDGKKSKKSKSKKTAAPEPAIEETVVEETVIEETVAEEPIAEDALTPIEPPAEIGEPTSPIGETAEEAVAETVTEPAPQEAPAKKKRTAKKAVKPEPPIEETVIEEATVEEAVAEEPTPAEESESVDLPSPEETVTEAPIEEISIEEILIEEATVEEIAQIEAVAEEVTVAEEIPVRETISEESEPSEAEDTTKEPIVEESYVEESSVEEAPIQELIAPKEAKAESKPLRPAPARPRPASAPRAEVAPAKAEHAPSRIIPAPAVKPTENREGLVRVHVNPEQNRRDPSQAIRIPRVGPRSSTSQPNLQQKVAMQKEKHTELPKSRGSDAIVITPRESAKQNEPIVIKPRQVAPTPKPTKIESEQPIRPAVEPAPKAVTPAATTAEQPKASAPKPQKRFGGTTLPRTHAVAKKPTAAEEQAQPETDGRKAPAEPAFEVVAKTIKQKPVKKPAPMPARPIPIEDEHLSEALEEMIPSTKEIGITEEQLPSAPTVRESAKVAPAKPASVETDREKPRRHSSRRRRSIREAEESIEALDVIERKLGMTVQDIHLIFELGYENELGRLVGYETLKKLKFEHVRRARTPDESHFSMAYGYRDQEYTGKQKKDEILGHYTKDRWALIWRIVATALLSILLIPLDLHSLFGELLAPYSALSPYLFPALSSLALTLAALLHLRPILAGMKSLLRFAPTPYSVGALFLPLSLLYSLVSLLFVGRCEMLPIALSASLTALLFDVCDLLRIGDEMASFGIVSSGGAKTVLETETPRKRKLRHGDKIVKIINDDIAERFYRIRRSEQISGFFRRSNDFSSASRPFTALLAAVTSLAFLVGVGAAVLCASLAAAFSYGMLTLALALPTTATVLYFYPRIRANRQLIRRNCALVGEESVGEYGNQKTVIFEDTDFYSVRKFTQSAVGADEELQRDVRLAGLLFSKIRGTLGALSRQAQKENDPPVTVLRMTDNGTEAIVENQYHLLAGNAAFMEKNGIHTPKSKADRPEQERVSVMYVAVDGALKLAYEIEYAVSRKFERIANLLAQLDTATAIRTYDPNLNDEFLQSGRAPDAPYVRVLKPGRFEPDETLTVSDCGAVALGAASNICRPIVAATVIRRIRRVGYRLQAAATALGTVGAALLLILGAPLSPAVMAILPPVWHASWALASAIYTRVSLHSGVAENLK